MIATLRRVYEEIGESPAEATCAAPIAERMYIHGPSNAEQLAAEELAATKKCLGGSQARLRMLTNNLGKYFTQHVGIGP
jgi:hypothetical protein